MSHFCMLSGLLIRFLKDCAIISDLKDSFNISNLRLERRVGSCSQDKSTFNTFARESSMGIFRRECVSAPDVRRMGGFWLQTVEGEPSKMEIEWGFRCFSRFLMYRMGISFRDMRIDSRCAAFSFGPVHSREGLQLPLLPSIVARHFRKIGYVCIYSQPDDIWVRTNVLRTRRNHEG